MQIHQHSHGCCLINLTDVRVAAHVINFAHKIRAPSKPYLQPCCRFMLDKTCESGELVAINIPSPALRLQKWFNRSLSSSTCDLALRFFTLFCIKQLCKH